MTSLTIAPLIDLIDVTRRFAPPRDVVDRFAERLGLLKRKGTVLAVDQASLSLMPGEILAVVGESGCGKSTLGRIAAGVIQPNEGRVRYNGEDFNRLPADRQIAAKLNVQIVFQDPYSSLNPRKRLGDAIGEAPRVHGLIARAELPDYVAKLMQRCGLDPALAARFPHQLSGGQRQRAGIARALAVNPRALVCDEAIAALDVSIQAQILNLFLDLRDDLGLGYLFITHDVSVVERVADRVAVMYLGRIVELGRVGEVLDAPAHPYTVALEREVPRINRRGRALKPLEGEMPSPLNPPRGCAFHPRCPGAMPICRTSRPTLQMLGASRLVACHLYGGAPESPTS